MLEDLEDGTHTWLCSAENELGTANVTYTFTGAFLSFIFLHFFLHFLVRQEFVIFCLTFVLVQYQFRERLRRKDHVIF